MAVPDVAGVEPREKMMKIVNKGDKKVYLVAQELKLARVLAGNNKAARDRALKSLRKWFTQRSKAMPFTEDDFQRIWKGLYYSMWISDKPLVQEQCAENISSLTDFPTLTDSLMFYKAGMTILINEWFGIDQLRLDKFLMLVRRLLRQILMSLKRHGLNKKNVDSFSAVLSQTILSTTLQPPIGLFMHFTEIFLEELAKVTKGNIYPDRLVEILKPFIKKLATTDDIRQIRHIKKFIFTYLMVQSNLGLEYQVKYEAWKKAGFPGSINSMQKVKMHNGDEEGSNDKVPDSDSHDKPLDPRAGRVDVELPRIKFKPKAIADVLLEYKFDQNSNTKSRKLIRILADQFNKLSNGVYPLGINKVVDDKEEVYDTNVRKAANRLIKFENKLLGKNKKRKRSRDDDATEVDVPRKKKQRRIEETVNEEVDYNNEDSAPDELAKFIERSEGNLKRKPRNVVDKKRAKNRSRATQAIIDDIECVFERNSGTWVVYHVRKDDERQKLQHEGSGDSMVVHKKKLMPSKSSESASKSTKGPDSGKDSPSLSSGSPSKSIGGTSEWSPRAGGSRRRQKASEDSSAPDLNSSPKSGLNPVKLFKSPERTELFPKTEWDEPVQEGEYEICIPSSKYLGKLKKSGKTLNQSLQVITTTTQKIKGKSRFSLDASLMQDPFSTPTSVKRVKINTKLNRSQEVHEHHAQIRCSPGIPYDANKKPSKPLLKTPISSTPINPFYSKQLNVC